MDTGFFPGTGAPRDWSMLIPFDSPYAYKGGNLLLEVRTISPSQQSPTIDAMSPTQTTGQSAFGWNDTATIADIGTFSVNWAMGLEVTAVPKPRAYLMLGVVALVVFIFRATPKLSYLQRTLC